MGFLAAFSSKATREDKLHFLFNVHDMDGNGLLSADDLELMLRQLAGSSLGSVFKSCTALLSVKFQHH